MNRDDQMTFVGPVTGERLIVGGNRVSSAYFLLMPAGGDPIKLEYTDRATATAARGQLIKNPGTYGVPSTRLLRAIHEAIQSTHPAADAEDDAPIHRLG